MKNRKGCLGIWIPIEICLLDGLKWIDKLMLREINSLSVPNGCYAQNKYFAQFFSLSVSRISEIIKKLEHKKLIFVERKTELVGGNYFISRVIFPNRGIVPTPFGKPNPPSENTHTPSGKANPPSENTAYINTSSIHNRKTSFVVFKSGEEELKPTDLKKEMRDYIKKYPESTFAKNILRDLELKEQQK
jgi:hypothetical protein